MSQFAPLCRLWEQGKKTRAKLEAARMAAEAPVDNATGRPLFSPRINPPLRNGATSVGPPQGVGDRLYTTA